MFQSGPVTSRAGHAWHRRVIHRRALVTDHKARKGAGAVAALARRAADRDMVARRELEHRGRHVGKAPARSMALRAIGSKHDWIPVPDPVLIPACTSKRAGVVFGRRQLDVVAWQI